MASKQDVFKFSAIFIMPLTVLKKFQYTKRSYYTFRFDSSLTCDTGDLECKNTKLAKLGDTTRSIKPVRTATFDGNFEHGFICCDFIHLDHLVMGLKTFINQGM